MVFDTNLIIEHIRRRQTLPSRAIIPVIVVGELEAFALKSDWGYHKVTFMQWLFEHFPIVEVTREITPIYALVYAYSQGNLADTPFRLGCRQEIWGKMIYGLLQLPFI